MLVIVIAVRVQHGVTPERLLTTVVQPQDPVRRWPELAGTRWDGVWARSYKRCTRLAVRVLGRSFIDGWNKFT
jgi:hypothetical protein